MKKSPGKIIFASIFLLISFSVYSEKITFKADAMKGSTSDKNDRTSLTGNAFVKTDTMEISADKIEMHGENFRFIDAVGKVKGKNYESNLEFTCEKLTYDRETKIANIVDNVHLIDTENDVTADAQIIEYNQNTEIATMQIGVKLLQKDNVCTGAYAIYRKKAQILELTGNPKITQGEDTFRAHEIKLNLDTQEITLDSRVSGTVSDTKEEKPKKAKAEEAKETDPASQDEKESENKNENITEAESIENSDEKNTELGEAKTETSSSPSENDGKTEDSKIMENPSGNSTLEIKSGAKKKIKRM